MADRAPDRRHVAVALAHRYPEVFRACHRDYEGGQQGRPGKTTKAQAELFVRLLAWELHQEDDAWGLNGKRGTSELSQDVVTYRLGHDRNQGIDLVRGAGGPNPEIVWQVFPPNNDAAGRWIRPDPIDDARIAEVMGWAQPPGPQPEPPRPDPGPSPQPGPQPPPSATIDSLGPEEFIRPGESLTSPGGRFTLTLQGDGNIVLYDLQRQAPDGGALPVWASDTAGATPDALIMQGDGNFVAYAPDASSFWDSVHSEFPHDPVPGSSFALQADGNGVIYTPDGTPIWDTKTVAPPAAPPEPEPGADAVMLVVADSRTGRPVVNALVERLDANGVAADQRVTDGGGFVHLPTGEAGTFRVSGDGYHAFEGLYAPAHEPHQVQIERVEVPSTFRFARGQFRVADGDRCFMDDNGPFVACTLHYGDGFARYCVEPGNAVRGLDQARTHGIPIVRSWITLNNDGDQRNPWALDPYRGGTGPRVTPNWRGKLIDWGREHEARGLIWHCSFGGLDMLSRPQQREAFHELTEAIAVLGPERFAMVEAVNECLAGTVNRGDEDPRWLDELIQIPRSRFPQILYALSATGGSEDPRVLGPYNGFRFTGRMQNNRPVMERVANAPGSWTRFLLNHGYRGGEVHNKAEHRFAMGYENGMLRLLWDGEACGPWSVPYGDDNRPKVSANVSVQANDHQFNEEAMGVIAAKAFVGRHVFSIMTSSGVRFVRDFDAMDGDKPWYPGVRSIPRLANLLPQDMQTYETLAHGGEQWRGTRVLVATPTCRPDMCIAHDGRFVIATAVTRPGYQELPIERRFRGLDGADHAVMIHPGTGEVTPINGRTDRLPHDAQYGRVIVGRVE